MWGGRGTYKNTDRGEVLMELAELLVDDEQLVADGCTASLDQVVRLSVKGNGKRTGTRA